MHVVLYLDNLFPLSTHQLLSLCICTKVMYDMQPTKNVVHVADFFFFIVLGTMLKFSTTKGIISSLQCWIFLKEELCMMVWSVVNPLNVNEIFFTLPSTWLPGLHVYTTNDDISSNKCLKVLKYVSASPDCIGSIPRVNGPDPVLTWNPPISLNLY